jgi:nitrite reductase/ring-hydroxylating ferredoxin subunit
VRQKICDLEDLTEFSCKEFRLNLSTGQEDAFFVYVNKCCYAYLNHCPHTGASLNWQDEVFLSFDHAFIQCSLHGALFEIASGKCVRGPCLGQNLKPLEVLIDNGAVYIA